MDTTPPTITSEINPENYSKSTKLPIPTKPNSPTNNKLSLAISALIFCGTLAYLLPPSRLLYSFHQAIYPINACAIGFVDTCSPTNWLGGLILFIIPFLVLLVALLLGVFRNKQVAQIAVLVLVGQLAATLSHLFSNSYAFQRPEILINILIQTRNLIICSQLGLAIYAAIRLGGRSIGTPINIGKRELAIITALFVCSVLFIYFTFPLAWRHYQDRVMGPHLQETADKIADAFKNLPAQHIDPEAIAREDNVEFFYIGTNYQLCGWFHYDASGGTKPRDFLHHAAGKQCFTYQVPSAQVYNQDIRVDKDMLVISRDPAFEIAAMSLDGPTDTQASRIDQSQAKYFTPDGKSSDSFYAKPGSVITYYWRQDNRTNKVYVYKIVIQESAQDPRFCKLIDAGAASYYCPGTTTNLTLLSVDTAGTQGAIHAKTQAGQEVTQIFQNPYKGKIKDRNGIELPLTRLTPGTRINLIYGGYSKEQLDEIDTL